MKELYLNTNKCTNADFRTEVHLNNMESFLTKCKYEDTTDDGATQVEDANELKVKELEAEIDRIKKIFMFCFTSITRSDFNENVV